MAPTPRIIPPHRDLILNERQFTVNIEGIINEQAGTIHVRPDIAPLVKYVLVTNRQIMQMVDEVAHQLRVDYPKGRMAFIPVLKGAIPFSMEVFKRSSKYIGTDPESELMSASSYGSKLDSGEVTLKADSIDRLLKMLDHKNRGPRIVGITEDMVDSARTMMHMIDVLYNIDEYVQNDPVLRENYTSIYRPADIVVITMLDKPDGRDPRYTDFVPTYRGFQMKKKWAFGFGLDSCNGRDRWTDDIYVMADIFMEEYDEQPLVFYFGNAREAVTDSELNILAPWKEQTVLRTFIETVDQIKADAKPDLMYEFLRESEYKAKKELEKII